MFPIIAFETLYFSEIDSTNEEARRLLNMDSLNQPVIIHAESQTQGRGSRGRVWASPSGKGLYFSIVHPSPGVLSLSNPDSTKRAPIFEADWSFFTRTAGLACAQILHEEIGLNIQLKPINDLYLNGRKLGGILCESIFGNASSSQQLLQDQTINASFFACKGLITGIGINLRQSKEVEGFCEAEERSLSSEQGSIGNKELIRGINQPISLEEALPPPIFAQWLNQRERVIVNHLLQALAFRVDTLYRRLLWEAGFVDILTKELVQGHR